MTKVKQFISFAGFFILLALDVVPSFAGIADPFDGNAGVVVKNETNADVRYEMRNGKKVKITRRVHKIVRQFDFSGSAEENQKGASGSSSSSSSSSSLSSSKTDVARDFPAEGGSSQSTSSGFSSSGSGGSKQQGQGQRGTQDQYGSTGISQSTSLSESSRFGGPSSGGEGQTGGTSSGSGGGIQTAAGGGMGTGTGLQQGGMTRQNQQEASTGGIGNTGTQTGGQQQLLQQNGLAQGNRTSATSMQGVLRQQGGGPSSMTGGQSSQQQQIGQTSSGKTAGRGNKGPGDDEEEEEDLSQMDTIYGRKKNEGPLEAGLPEAVPSGGQVAPPAAAPPILPSGIDPLPGGELVKGNCHEGWFTFGAPSIHCYRAFAEPGIDWETSQQKCKQQGGNLASIHNHFDNQFLYNVILYTMILRNIEFTYFWVGMKRTSQNDGQSFVSSWADGSAVGYGLAEKFPDHIYPHIWNVVDFATYHVWNPKMEPWSEKAFGNEQCVYMSLNQHRVGTGWVSTGCNKASQERGKNELCEKLKSPTFSTFCELPKLSGYICQI